jgi:hypothetical protein
LRSSLSPNNFAREPQALERFQREARAASVLNHPGICTIYEMGQAAGQPFLAMELLEGQTLRYAIASRARPAEQVLEYGIRIAEALEAVHSKGIIHSDIKPVVTQRVKPKALAADQNKLMLFEVSRQQWSELATGREFEYPNWSRNGQFIYIENDGHDGAELLRVTLRRARRSGFRP